MAEEKFGIDKQWSQDFEVAQTSKGEKVMGKKHIVEFKSPLGHIRLEKITRPRIIDKKVLHSRRIGSGTSVDYVYSDEEPVIELKIYKKRTGGEWEEISPETMGIT